MIVRLYLYFGIVGIASIVAWLGALALPVNFAFHQRRTFFLARAVMLALVGLLLAQINSFNISRIEVDHRQELNEARERQRRAQQEEVDILKRRAANIRFAEDSFEDQLDLAGVQSSDKRSIYEQAADARTGAEQREKTGRKRWRPIGAQPTDADEALIAGPQDAEPAGRMLPQRDVNRADQLDLLNLWMARLVLLALLLALIWDYFNRFRRTLGVLLPLPFAGRLVDSLFPKTHSVVFRSARSDLIASYLETVVRKGECFMYCGGTDLNLPPAMARFHLPLPLIWRYFLELIRPYFLIRLVTRIGNLPAGGQALKSRLARWCGCSWLRTLGAILKRQAGNGLQLLRRWILALSGWLHNRLSAMAWLRYIAGMARKYFVRLVPATLEFGNRVKRVFRRLINRFRNGIIELHPVRIIQVGLPSQSSGHNFVFECAWYNRYCFTDAGAGSSAALVAAFRQFLGERLVPRASAAATVHLLWNCGVPLSPDLLHPLAVFSKEVNLKLVVFAADNEIAAVGKWMEEVCPDEAPTRDRPSMMALVLMRIRQVLKNIQPWFDRRRQQRQARRERIKSERYAIAARAEAASREQAREEASLAEASRKIAAQADEAARVELARAEAAKAELARSAAIKAEAAQAEIARAQAAKAGVVQAKAAPAPQVRAPETPAKAAAVRIQSPKVSQDSAPVMPGVPSRQNESRAKPAPVLPAAVPVSVPKLAADLEAPGPVPVKAPVSKPTVLAKPQPPVSPAEVVPKVAPVVKATQSPPIVSAKPLPRVETAQPGPAPVVKPVVKTPAKVEGAGLNAPKLEPLESPRIVSSPVVKTEKPPAPRAVVPATGSEAFQSAPKPRPKAVVAKKPVPDQGGVPSKPEQPPVPPQSAAAQAKPQLKSLTAQSAAASSPIAEVDRAAGVFKFYCPLCRQKLSVRMDGQGKTIVCPACNQEIVIPGLD